jgi:hypothetical protein
VTEPRVAGPAEAEIVAEALHAFNVEFDTPTPGTVLGRALAIARERGSETFEINV